MELYLNDEYVGTKEVNDCKVTFCVRYTAGTLKAIAYDTMDNKIGESELRSASGKTHIRVTPETNSVSVGHIMYAVLLNYPLVTGRQYKTGCGFTTLMGDDLTEADIDYMSLELHITPKTPPMFLIHGMNDSVIPVQHSMLLAQACAQNHVACEARFLQNGNHGITTMDSTAEDAQESHYVFNQLYEAIHAMSQEELESYTDILGSVSQDMSYEEFLEYMAPKGMMLIFMKALNSKPEDMRNLSHNSTVKPNLSASDWFEWADNWLKILPVV